MAPVNKPKAIRLVLKPDSREFYIIEKLSQFRQTEKKLFADNQLPKDEIPILKQINSDLDHVFERDLITFILDKFDDETDSEEIEDPRQETLPMTA